MCIRPFIIVQWIPEALFIFALFSDWMLSLSLSISSLTLRLSYYTLFIQQIFYFSILFFSSRMFFKKKKKTFLFLFWDFLCFFISIISFVFISIIIITALKSLQNPDLFHLQWSSWIAFWVLSYVFLFLYRSAKFGLYSGHYKWYL